MSAYSYALTGNIWPSGKTVLTYSFATSAVNGNPFSGSITDATERAEIAAAFAAWTAITGIRFVELADGSTANIRLNFADNKSTSPALGLTSLSYNSAGITTPDSAVVMLEDPHQTPLVSDSSGLLYYAQGYNAESQDTGFEQLALHEIGHVLGFADNADPYSIENASLTAANRMFDATDLAGVKALYPDTAATILPAPSAVIVEPTLFTLTDGAETTAVTSSAYSGALSFLSHRDQFSYNGGDNVTIVASSKAANPLIASGSGTDLLEGSATGTSVLDAGTGANIDIDGGNGATTFVQNGYVSGMTWDFLENFHGADEDILFGYIPGLSKLSFIGNAGLGNDYGVTAVLQPGNGNTEEVTFAGVSMASLHGTSADIDGVPSWVLWTS